MRPDCHHHSKVEKRATKAYAGGKAVTGVVRDADIDLQQTIQLRNRDDLHLGLLCFGD